MVPKDPTIREVAALAGVSVSTVSRAFAAPDMVRPGTRQKIQQIAAKIGYSPNRIAQGLATGRTHSIAVLVPDLTNPFYPGIVKGVQLQANASGYSVIIADTGEDTESEFALSLLDQADGLILCSSRLDDNALSGLASRRPVVLCNRACDTVPSVVFDNEAALHQAIQHLNALGHNHVGWVGGPPESWSGQVRETAAHTEAVTAGVQLTDLGRFPARFDSGMLAADLALAANVTAIIAYNDLMALGAVRRLSNRGVRVPDDISVVGIDGSLMAEIASPALTSVTLPLERAGRACMRVLLDDIDQPGPITGGSRAVLPVQLTIRNSTAIREGLAT